MLVTPAAYAVTATDHWELINACMWASNTEPEMLQLTNPTLTMSVRKANTEAWDPSTGVNFILIQCKVIEDKPKEFSFNLTTLFFPHPKHLNITVLPPPQQPFSPQLIVAKVSCHCHELTTTTTIGVVLIMGTHSYQHTQGTYLLLLTFLQLKRSTLTAPM